jgi:hypothetical protein
MKYRFSVWLDDRAPRWFPTFEAAERYARRAVAASASDTFAIRADISEVFHTVATVRLDGADRVWTDMAA